MQHLARRTREFPALAGLAVAVALAAVPAAAEPVKPVQTQAPKSAPAKKAKPAALKRQEPPKTEAEYARRFIANKTHRHFSGQHGTQLVYHAPGGKVFLWYPGNPIILPGEWRVEEMPNAPKLWEMPPGSGNIVERTLFWPCYRYPEASYNPATRRRGGNWECVGLMTGLGEIRDGDPLKLAKAGPVPFIMAKRLYSYDELLMPAKASARGVRGAQPALSGRARPGG